MSILKNNHLGLSGRLKLIFQIVITFVAAIWVYLITEDSLQGMLGIAPDEDIDAIIERGRKRTEDINQRLEEASKGDLLDFKLDGGVSTVWEGTDRCGNLQAPFNFWCVVVCVRCFCLYSVACISRRSCPSLGRKHGRGAARRIT